MIVLFLLFLFMTSKKTCCFKMSDCFKKLSRSRLFDLFYKNAEKVTFNKKIGAGTCVLHSDYSIARGILIWGVSLFLYANAPKEPCI